MRTHAQRAEFAFAHPLRVRWAEVDPQGIVFHPHYLAYADVAMTEYMRALGHVYPAEVAAAGADLFAVHTEIDYRGSAKYDDELALAARVAYLGHTSFRMLFAFFAGPMLLTEVRNTYVHASLDEHRRPLPLREDLVTSILAHERVPPERKPGR